MAAGLEVDGRTLQAQQLPILGRPGQSDLGQADGFGGQAAADGVVGVILAQQLAPAALDLGQGSVGGDAQNLAGRAAGALVMPPPDRGNLRGRSSNWITAALPRAIS